MWAVNWAGTKKIIDLKLSLYLLKQTIICKSYDVHRKVTSVLSLKTFYVYTDLPQNRFRTLTYSKWEVYSEPCHTSTMKRWLVSRLIIFASYNYFCESYRKYLEVFSPVVVMLLWKTITREGAGDREFLIYLLIYSNHGGFK